MPQNLFNSGLPAQYCGAAPSLLNAKFVPISGSAIATGDHDLYTVPAGRQTLIDKNVKVFNTSAGNISYYGEIKVSGTYYRLTSTPAALAAGVAAQLDLGSSIVLQAGESLSFNTATTNGLNVRGGAWEWDATDTRVATARNLALASGDNTLLTVPAGKTAAAMYTQTIPAMGIALASVCNATGGSLNYFWKIGGLQVSAAAAIANNAASSATVGGSLAAGETVIVNSSGADAGNHHIAWFTYIQLP